MQPAGYECLKQSIESFLSLYQADVTICHNCSTENLDFLDGKYPLLDQRTLQKDVQPLGVAWKLYPPRLEPDRHEIVIDNDIVFMDRIPEIDRFLETDCTLLLEGSTRNYGRFERHVPPGCKINSGIFGMPPTFNLDRFMRFHVAEWELNAVGEYAASKTFDEQGLVALALLSYSKTVIMPETSVTNCERELIWGKAMHFIGLNRRAFHHPYQLFKHSTAKLYL